MQTQLEIFAELVHKHDLTYSYTEDHSVWERGEKERTTIRKMAAALPIEDVKRTWNAEVDRKISRFPESFYWRVAK